MKRSEFHEFDPGEVERQCGQCGQDPDAPVHERPRMARR